LAVMFCSPAGLDEDGVDLGQVDGAGLGSDGFEQAAEGEVSGAAKKSLGGADDEGERFLGEDAVSEAGAVELVEEELFDVLGGESLKDDRIGDAGADLLVDAELERLHEGRLADEDEVVTSGEVLTKQAQFAQAVAGHEVGVVDDGHEHLAGAVDLVGLLDEEFLSAVVRAGELDLKGRAEDAQGVMVGVKGAVDDGGDEAFGVVFEQGVFEDALARAGLAADEAQAALQGVDLEYVEDFLRVEAKGCELSGKPPGSGWLRHAGVVIG